jgi:hypothetical protein
MSSKEDPPADIVDIDYINPTWHQVSIPGTSRLGFLWKPPPDYPPRLVPRNEVTTLFGLGWVNIAASLHLTRHCDEEPVFIIRDGIQTEDYMYIVELKHWRLANNKSVKMYLRSSALAYTQN